MHPRTYNLFAELITYERFNWKPYNQDAEILLGIDEDILQMGESAQPKEILHMGEVWEIQGEVSSSDSQDMSSSFLDHSISK